VLLRFLYSVVFERKRFVIKILAVNWAKILVARLQLKIGGRASHASQFLKGASLLEPLWLKSLVARRMLDKQDHLLYEGVIYLLLPLKCCQE
jgi:hypothetical protein